MLISNSLSQTHRKQLNALDADMQFMMGVVSALTITGLLLLDIALGFLFSDQILAGLAMVFEWVAA